MKKITLVGLTVLLLASTLGVLSAQAVAPVVPTQVIPAGPDTGAELLTTVRNITNWIFAVFLVIAVIFILLAAFQFLTGGGEPEQIGQARQKLIYAVLAIVIAVISRGLVTAIAAITRGSV